MGALTRFKLSPPKPTGTAQRAINKAYRISYVRTGAGSLLPGSDDVIGAIHQPEGEIVLRLHLL